MFLISIKNEYFVNTLNINRQLVTAVIINCKSYLQISPSISSIENNL